MKVEYLIIIDSSSAFCGNIQSFNNFLQSNSEIKIQGKRFKFKNLEIDYEIQEGLIKTDNHIYYHIKFNCENDATIDEFVELLRAVKNLLHKASDKKPQTLWDDISFYYANKSYPLIHEIENLMRKLITKFMLTNVGLGWTKEDIPNDLKIATKTSKDNKNTKDNYNYLYETDFIQLANFLFDEYKKNDAEKLLIEKLRNTTNLETITLAELKNFIPKSNWDRYFAGYVECEKSYLQTRWKKLYEIRCQIAHNNVLIKQDYEEILKLVDEIKPKLEKAIENLDKIEVPENDRENLAENVAINMNTFYGEYIQKWKMLEKQLHDLLDLKLKDNQDEYRNMRYSTLKLLGLLVDKEIIEQSLYHAIQRAMKVRNFIVHEADNKFSALEIRNEIQNIDKIHETIGEYFVENDDE